MKTLISSALIAVAALTAAPAIAQVPAGALGAIAHFNQDHDSQDQRITVIRGASTGLATRSGGISEAQIRFNSDFDNQDNARKIRGAAIFSGSPRNSADIFARIRAESAENE